MRVRLFLVWLLLFFAAFARADMPPLQMQQDGVASGSATTLNCKGNVRCIKSGTKYDVTVVTPTPTVTATVLATATVTPTPQRTPPWDLSTDTNGDYVSGATSGGGLTKTGTEGATLGITPCADGQIQKFSSGAWGCAADATGGGAGNSFETITTSSGTAPVADNSTDTLTITGTAPVSVTGSSAADSITIAIAPAFSDISGTAADGQIPSGITRDNGDTYSGTHDFSSATVIIPKSATLPATCTEGSTYQDTNSLGIEVYACTATNVWTKFATIPGDCVGSGKVVRYTAATDAWSCGTLADADIPDTITVNLASTATALAANGGNCSAGSAAGGVDASGAAESCLAIPATPTPVPTPGSDPALSAKQCNLAQEGIVCEGTTADAFEALLTFVDPTADRTFTFPDASGAVCIGGQTCSITVSGNASTATALAANGANCSAGNYPLGVDAGGAVESCTADDDTPESGDFGNLTGGAGITNTAGTLATASDEADFVKSGALTCGASTQGKMQVHTTPLQYCDNTGTPTLRYAAYGSSTGVATTATALAANGGNCSAGSFPLGVDASGASETCTAVAFTAAGTSGSNQTISNGDTLTIAAGSGITVTAGATDTITIAAVPAPSPSPTIGKWMFLAGPTSGPTPGAAIWRVIDTTDLPASVTTLGSTIGGDELTNPFTIPSGTQVDFGQDSSKAPLDLPRDMATPSPCSSVTTEGRVCWDGYNDILGVGNGTIWQQACMRGQGCYFAATPTPTPTITNATATPTVTATPTPTATVSVSPSPQLTASPTPTTLPTPVLMVGPYALNGNCRSIQLSNQTNSGTLYCGTSCSTVTQDLVTLAPTRPVVILDPRFFPGVEAAWGADYVMTFERTNLASCVATVDGGAKTCTWVRPGNGNPRCALHGTALPYETGCYPNGSGVTFDNTAMIVYPGEGYHAVFQRFGTWSTGTIWTATWRECEVGGPP